jgi:hypothetical protein
MVQSDWFALYWLNRGQALRDEKGDARINQGINQWSSNEDFTARFEFVKQLRIATLLVLKFFFSN